MTLTKFGITTLMRTSWRATAAYVCLTEASGKEEKKIGAVTKTVVQEGMLDLTRQEVMLPMDV